VTTVPVRRALLSVFDKTGLVDLAARLVACDVELVSSGGTAAHLRQAGLDVTSVADVTGAAEMLGGRVKTLHPAIHGAILADRGDPAHIADLHDRDIAPIELVVVNLYPFEQAVASGAPRAEIIEQIDIGGPAMVRAAAKNHAWVGVVTSPDRYPEVAAAVEAGGLSADLRASLAADAFFRTASYDAAIVGWLEAGEEQELPARLVLAVEQLAALRYGENPHQPAALYCAPFTSAWWRVAEQLQGKHMSFNNYVDAEAAWRLASDLPAPAAVIVKHSNACGAAVVTGSLVAAFEEAWECDPLSAFGGVVAVNAALDEATAAAIASRFVEVVVAPAVEGRAAAVLSAKENLRLLVAHPPHGFDLDLRRVEDGLLAQVRDRMDGDGWQVMTAREPGAAEIDDLRFAWIVAAHTKSNAIVVARGGAAVGVGAGDQSRVGAAERALAKAGDRARSAVAASDAFFPFRDGVDALAAAGVTAVIQPGGSVRDDEVVAAADEHGMAMVFTGRRHFRH
jgi:phosphoribosylaminoimidazolecarboxamide formyltransferase/IMP cyclohydrolase